MTCFCSELQLSFPRKQYRFHPCTPPLPNHLRMAVLRSKHANGHAFPGCNPYCCTAYHFAFLLFPAGWSYTAKPIGRLGSGSGCFGGINSQTAITLFPFVRVPIRREPAGIFISISNLISKTANHHLALVLLPAVLRSVRLSLASTFPYHTRKPR